MFDDVGRGMVNGRLAMTRSIGDLELKRYGVSAVPDVRKIKVRVVLQYGERGAPCAVPDFLKKKKKEKFIFQLFFTTAAYYVNNFVYSSSH